MDGDRIIQKKHMVSTRGKMSKGNMIGDEIGSEMKRSLIGYPQRVYQYDGKINPAETFPRESPLMDTVLHSVGVSGNSRPHS